MMFTIDKNETMTGHWGTVYGGYCDLPIQASKKATFDSFMLFIHHQEYRQEHLLYTTVEEKSALTPSYVVCWMYVSFVHA